MLAVMGAYLKRNNRFAHVYRLKCKYSPAIYEKLRRLSKHFLPTALCQRFLSIFLASSLNAFLLVALPLNALLSLLSVV
jgi:hypothetical protein